MDWSKSKTIFIVVFLILNIFLYTQYIDVYTQGKQVEFPGEKTTESQLKEDNITYITLPNNIEEVSYISGKMKNFTNLDVQKTDFMESIIVDDYIIESTLTTPVKLTSLDEESVFTDFVQLYALEGKNYKLWNVNKEERYALFFQKINDRTLYYNSSGYLKLYWNENDEVYKFEQTMLDKIEELEQEETAFLPIQVLQSLYSKGLLQPNSRVISMNLGYSTLVQLTQTQVFAPTWEIRVRREDGTVDEHFVNAIEGKVIDIQSSSVELEDLE